MADKRKDKDYKVGYGKPPKEHRFRKGQSGNPKGRPKGSKNTGNIIAKVANEKVEITFGGEKRKVTLKEAIIRRAYYAALQGDRNALKLVIPWLQQSDPEISTQYVIEAPPEMTLEQWERAYGPTADYEPPPPPYPGDKEPPT